MSSLDRKALLPAAILTAGLAVTLVRCFYGVDFTDEAQYVAQAYVPTIGGAPFDTDLFLQQTTSLLLVPWVWIYTHLLGSTDGLVLFFRILWWVAAGATGIILYRRFRHAIGAIRAALIGCLPIVVIPFGIPSPSYNSFGILLLTLGLCTRNPTGTFELIALGIATLCYPPFMIAAAGTLFFARAFRKGAIMAGSGLGCGIASVIAFGFPHLRESFQFTSLFGTFGGTEKLSLWKTELLPLIHGSLIEIPLAAHYWITLIALAGLPFTLRRDALIPRHLVALSLICGLLSGWASSNGFYNVAIGIFPAFIAALIAWSVRLSSSQRIKIAQTTGLAVITLAFTWQSYHMVYRDAPIPLLTERVASGPYQGLMTYPDRAKFIQALQHDVRETTGEVGNVLYLYGFPAGYLLTRMTPATKMLFLHDREYPEAIRSFIIPKSVQDYPDWMVLLKGANGDSALNKIFADQQRYEIALDRPAYFIFKKKP